MELLKLNFKDVQLTCPISEGHRMIPIRTVCQIIDVDFKRQDSWLKSHPFYSQLYKPRPTVASDNKQRMMNCLSFFDTFGWLNSLSNNNRKPGSIEKQNTFMAWLREKHMEIYKSIEMYERENQYERELLDLKMNMIDDLEEAQDKVRLIKKDIKIIDETLQDVRSKRFTGQTAIPFTEDQKPKLKYFDPPSLN